MTVYELGSTSSPVTESSSTLILDLSTFTSVSNKCLLLVSHPVWVFCYKQPNKQTHQSSICLEITTFYILVYFLLGFSTCTSVFFFTEFCYENSVMPYTVHVNCITSIVPLALQTLCKIIWSYIINGTDILYIHSDPYFIFLAMINMLK